MAIEGLVTITVKSASLIAKQVEKGGKNLDPYVKITVGKTHKWESKTIRRGALNPNFNSEYKRF